MTQKPKPPHPPNRQHRHRLSRCRLRPRGPASSRPAGPLAAQRSRQVPYCRAPSTSTNVTPTNALARPNRPKTPNAAPSSSSSHTNGDATPTSSASKPPTGGAQARPPLSSPPPKQPALSRRPSGRRRAAIPIAFVSHADRAYFERAADPLHSAGINPELLGDLTHARAPRSRQGLLDALL